MTLLGMLTQTATVVSFPMSAVDEYGNPVAGPEVRTDYPARLEQTESTEVTRGRDTVISDWRLFLPADALVDAYDRVEIEGSTFEVAGRPAVEWAPRGPHHTVARLRIAI